MIAITPLTGAIGADVHGLDLASPLTEATVARIHDALLEHQVLFFRDQPVLSVAQHNAIALNFGELESSPFKNDDDAPTLLMIEQTDARLSRGAQGANFHADNTFRPHPPMGALLQAHVLPDRGGGTCFASMYAAYDGLSDRMKAYLDGLEAYHSLEQMKMRLGRSSGVRLRLNLDDWPPQRHPVIATHPETGRRLLNVNYNWTTYIDGIPPAESDALLRFLYEHIKRPEYQVRMYWNVGDIAFWDNRCTQHCAIADYAGRRLMQRVAIAGSPHGAMLPGSRMAAA